MKEWIFISVAQFIWEFMWQCIFFLINWKALLKCSFQYAATPENHYGFHLTMTRLWLQPSSLRVPVKWGWALQPGLDWLSSPPVYIPSSDTLASRPDHSQVQLLCINLSSASTLFAFLNVIGCSYWCLLCLISIRQMLDSIS